MFTILSISLFTVLYIQYNKHEIQHKCHNMILDDESFCTDHFSKVFCSMWFSLILYSHMQQYTLGKFQKIVVDKKH